MISRVWLSLFLGIIVFHSRRFCLVLCGQSSSTEAQREKHVSEAHFARRERKQSLQKAFESKNYCSFAFHMFSVRKQHKRKRRHAHAVKEIDNQQDQQGNSGA